MSAELKPCPFCGGEPRMGPYDVHCYGTPFNRHVMIVLKHDEWNRRADLAPALPSADFPGAVATGPQSLGWNDSDEESTADSPLGNYAVWKSVEGWEASFRGALAPQMYVSREAAKAAAQVNYAALPSADYVRGLEAAAKIARNLEGRRVSVPCPDGVKGCLVTHFKTEAGPIEIAILAARPDQPAADTRVVTVAQLERWAWAVEGRIGDTHDEIREIVGSAKP